MMLPTGGYVMACNVEALGEDGTLESEVNFFRRLVDEHWRDCVHFQKVSPGLGGSIRGGEDPAPPVVGVDEDVKAKDVVVVVEAANTLLHHCVNLLVAAQDRFDDNVLHSIPKRFWVFTPLPHPSPELIDWPFVGLEKQIVRWRPDLSFVPGSWRTYFNPTNLQGQNNSLTHFMSVLYTGLQKVLKISGILISSEWRFSECSKRYHEIFW